MKKEKVLAVILAAAMTMGLAACGSDGNAGNSTTAATTAAAAAQTTAAGGTQAAGGAGAAATAEPDVIRILAVDQSSTLDDGKIVYLSDWINGGSTLWQRLTDDLLEHGIKLEMDLIASDQYATVVQTQIAAGLNCDMINLQDVDSKTRLNLVKQGILAPINQIWEQYSQDTTKEFFTTGYGAVENLNALEDGNVYWIGPLTIGDYKGQPWGSIRSASIRKDWLDKLNLPMPKTTDELFDALQAFQTQDVNTNGLPDEVVRVSLSGFSNGIAQMFGLGTDLVCFDGYDSDVVTSPWYQAGVKDYILFMKRLYDAGLLDMSEGGSEAKIENRLGLIATYWAGLGDEVGVIIPEGEAGAEYVGISCDPQDGVKPVLAIQDGVNKSSSVEYGFTTQANQAAVGRLLDYLSSEEYSTLTEFGIEGFSFDVEDGSMIAYAGSDNDEVKIVYKGAALWTYAGGLPRMEYVDRNLELSRIESGGFFAKAAAIREVFENPGKYELTRLSPSSRLLAATDEETQRSADIKADLDTYYSELLTKLIMGEQSMDDWDSYIADMQKLGLDELIQITQARYDRAKQ